MAERNNKIEASLERIKFEASVDNKGAAVRIAGSYERGLKNPADKDLKSVETLKYLRDFHDVDLSDTSVSDAHGNSITTVAAGAGNINVLRYLDRIDVDLSAPDSRGFSPATKAAVYGNVKSLECLHSLGVDVLAPDANGRTALDIARQHSNVNNINGNRADCVEFLEKVQAAKGETKAVEQPEVASKATGEKPTPPTPVTNHDDEPDAKKDGFDWDRASVKGSLSFLKNGTIHEKQTAFLQQTLQDVGVAKDIHEAQFGHYGPKTSAAMTTVQEAFKEAGVNIKDDGKTYVQGWAAVAALKETGTKLVDGKIPEDAQEKVLASYNEKLGEAREAIASKENSHGIAATDVASPSQRNGSPSLK